jgi:hypothetical protein
MTSTHLMNVVQQTLLSNNLLWFQSSNLEHDSNLKASPPNDTYSKPKLKMNQKHSHQNSQASRHPHQKSH